MSSLIKFNAMDERFYDSFKAIGRDTYLIGRLAALALSAQNAGFLSWAFAVLTMI
ncbi:hypothetical protein [Marinomonas sp. A3A]|uniref:hypothetical protein n=1 Tax=Marinomonas sp. A3A TaxID=2065312 RepID=UPI002017C061|nr:hypothetical protein [Marinomonas sp. A3A]